MKLCRVILLLCLMLTGCGEGEFSRGLPIAAPAGGRTGSTSERTQIAPMLQDPEAQEYIWSDYVWATDQAEAERFCQNIANRHRVGFVRAEQANKWRNSWGKARYSCFFQSEGEIRYDDRDHSN